MMNTRIVEFIRKNYNSKRVFIFLYFYDQFILGIFENNHLYMIEHYEEKLLTEIHIFNEEKEYRGKTMNSLVEITDNQDYFEEKMWIIGNKTKIQDQATIVTQQGRKLVLPYPIVSFDQASKNPLRLVVRHQFSQESGDIIGYRLVNIESGDEKNGYA